MNRFTIAVTLAIWMFAAFNATHAFAQKPVDDVEIMDEVDQKEDDGSPSEYKDVEEDILESEEPTQTPAEETAKQPQPPKPTTPRRDEYRKSAPEGEKIFDWSKYQNATEVPHPFAKKGLIRITKDKEYMYKVDESDQKRAMSFHLGVFNPENLENPDQAGQPGATFDENYDQTDAPAIMLVYEWQLLHLPIGKIGVRAGSGVYIAQGNGHFVSGVNQGREPREIFTFWMMPNHLGAVYRMQFWDKQLFVPYAEGGGIAFAFGEVRDDDKPPKWGGAFAGYFAGGLAFNLTYFDAISRIQLDREYGINRVYLTAEYRTIVAITQTYDFSSDLINGGFLMEF